MIERDHPKLSLVQQCLLLSICRSSLYYESKCTVLDDEYLVKEAIDRQYMITPYYGVRRMKVYLTSLGYIISRERVEYGHNVYPYAKRIPVSLCHH